MELGFDDCSIVAVRELPLHKQKLEDWLANGYDSTLNYMRRNIDLRADPSLLVPQASNIIVCLISYNKQPSTGEFASRVASYAHCTDYHKTIKGKLLSLIETIKQHCPDSFSRAFVDSAPVMEKAWAVEAGLGWIGRNSLLIHPRLGSFTLIGTIITTAKLETNYCNSDLIDKKPEDLCGACTLCIDSCPNGAILPNRTIDTNLCISRLTIERLASDSTDSGGRGSGGSIGSVGSTDFRGGGWLGGSADSEGSATTAPQLYGAIFGCDICQRCCPHNSGAPVLNHDIFTPIEQIESMTFQRFLSLTDQEFKDIFAATPLSRCSLERLKACISNK